MAVVVREYWLAITLAGVIVPAFAIVAVTMVDISARQGRPALVPVSRVLALGSFAMILVATALPYRWPLPGPRGYANINLTLGHGGLGDWRAVFEHPTSAAALLFVGNILLYVPFALFATIGWPRRRIAIVVGSVVASALVELAQYEWLRRSAALDDVFLNAVGAVAGCIAGSLIVARSHTIGSREEGEGRGEQHLPGHRGDRHQ